MDMFDTTCWTMIAAAAQGSRGEREQFACRYLGSVRAYLISRWRGTPFLPSVDDAVQDVFVECFRSDGPLGRVERSQSGGFRPYLYGIVRNVARRVESKKAAEYRNKADSQVDLSKVPTDETHLSKVFDRAWAKSIMRQAAQQQRERAEDLGEAAIRRVELLRLRFEEGLPIRSIAQLWQVDPTGLHRQYAKARQEFKTALQEVVTFHHPGSDAEVQREIATILALLG